jgi:hypothetical protein
MAKNYCDNLSEETRKGMLEKARQGLWPSYAPLGYLNVDGANGKRTISPDPNLAPAIARLFQQYATGTHSLKSVAKLAQSDGLRYRKSGDAIPTSTIHKILRNRIYTGDFDFDGVTYTGTYEPVVSKELWNRVQHPRRPWFEKHAPSKGAVRIQRAAHVWPLRLRLGGRNQKGALCLLPLHRLQGEVPGEVHARGGLGGTVRARAEGDQLHRGRAGLDDAGVAREPRGREEIPGGRHSQATGGAQTGAVAY